LGFSRKRSIVVFRLNWSIFRLKRIEHRAKGQPGVPLLVSQYVVRTSSGIAVWGIRSRIWEFGVVKENSYRDSIRDCQGLTNGLRLASQTCPI
jgi:hypothetical protein